MTLYDYPPRDAGDRQADRAEEPGGYRYADDTLPGDHFRSVPSRRPPYADDARPGGAHHRPEPYEPTPRPQSEPALYDSSSRLRTDAAPRAQSPAPVPPPYDSSTRPQAPTAYDSARPQPESPVAGVYDSSTRLQASASVPTAYDSARPQPESPVAGVYDSSTRLQASAPMPNVYDSTSRLQFEPASIQYPQNASARGPYPPESSARHMTDTRTPYVADPATRAKYPGGDVPAVPPVEWPSAQAVQAALAEGAPTGWAPTAESVPPAWGSPGESSPKGWALTAESAPPPWSPQGESSSQTWAPPVEQAAAGGGGPAAAKGGRAAMIGAVLAVAVASAGVTAGVMSAIGTGSGTTATAGPGGGPGQGQGQAGQGGRGGTFGGGNTAALHGTYVISDGNGGYTTQITQTGTVSAVSSSSITVKSQDGYSKTYVVSSSTSIDNGADKISSVAAGHTVRIVGTSANAKATATTITDTNLAMVGQQNNQSGQNPQNGQPPNGIPGGQPGTTQQNGTTTTGA